MKKGLTTILATGLLIAFNVANAQGKGDNPDPQADAISVDADGTVHVKSLDIPVSEYLSPEGKAYVAEHINVLRHPAMTAQPNGLPLFMAGYLDRQRHLYPTERQDTKIGGVHAYVYTPKGGIAENNARRVLINLHGGGFKECWPGCAELESIPISSVGGIKVVSLDYRQGPKYQFPAASEDVAAAYREMLKTYKPENIGIYGCSAGGMLTGMSLAWFQKHGLPAPGAVGIFCAGLNVAMGFSGDANYLATPAEGQMPFPASKEAFAGKPGSHLYLANADLNDPLVSPAVSMDVLAKFPPTLFITATRGIELSGAVNTHGRLVKAGVDAELHVWEGLFHAFFYNPDVPESRDCYDVIVKFFNRHLKE